MRLFIKTGRVMRNLGKAVAVGAVAIVLATSLPSARAQAAVTGAAAATAIGAIAAYIYVWKESYKFGEYLASKW